MLEQFGAEMQTDERGGMMTNSTVAGRQCAELVIKITHGDEQNQKGGDETALTNTSGLDNVTEKTTMDSFPMKNAGSDEYTDVRMLIQEDVLNCATLWLDGQPNWPLGASSFAYHDSCSEQGPQRALPPTVAIETPSASPQQCMVGDPVRREALLPPRPPTLAEAREWENTEFVAVNDDVPTCQQIIRELRDEVQYLRRMLAYVYEEKNIELAAVHNYVTVCHHIIKELRVEVQYLRKMLAHAHYERGIELTIAHGEIA